MFDSSVQEMNWFYVCILILISTVQKKKLVGEMEKITVFGISLKELQFGGFSTPPI